VKVDLFHADRERERERDGNRHAEANILLLQFVNAPKVYNTLKTSSDFSRYCNKLFVLITETEFAYCAVRTEYIHTRARARTHTRAHARTHARSVASGVLDEVTRRFTKAFFSF
jgi:hypothetical protein